MVDSRIISKAQKCSELAKEWKELSRKEIIKKYVDAFYSDGNYEWLKDDYEKRIEFNNWQHKNEISEIDFKYKNKIEELKYANKFLSGIFIGILIVLVLIIFDLQNRLYG